MAIDGDVADPLDVMSERLDLEVAPAVVRARQSSAVPVAVVDLDVEAMIRDAEIRMDHRAVAEDEPALTLERRETSLPQGSLEAQFVVRSTGSFVESAAVEDLPEALAPGRPDCTSSPRACRVGTTK